MGSASWHTSCERPGMLRLLVLVLASLLGLSTTACAVTGATSTFKVEVRPPPSTAPRLEIASVEIEPNQTRLANVGTYAWGEYDAEDLAVLKTSMRDSAAPFAAAPGAERHRVHVLLRRFLVATSNREGFALACVGWALESPNGEIAFHEQFYASSYVHLWGTVGGIKNDVHEGIARRVLQTAVVAAARPGRVEPAAAEHTFDDFASATKGLPESLESTYTNMLVFGNAYWFHRSSVSGKSDVAWARQPSHIDWQTRLAHAH